MKSWAFFVAAALAMPLPGVPRADAAATSTSWWSEPVTTVEGVSEYRLPNGLKVLLSPDASSSDIVVHMVYFVGSRHEGRGEKGMAHLLEHMLFKGTPGFPDPEKSLKERGARSNAETWTDRTRYYEALVASDDNLDFALHFEAERMVSTTISGEVLSKEMTVVRNEFETGESDSFQTLRQALCAQAYRWHPYRDATIGNRSDIERVPADNLRRFYRHHYRPSNAMLILAGRFDVQRALELIDRYFAGLQNPPEPIVDTWTEEPVQDGPRSFELQRGGSMAYVGLLYKSPAGSHPDATALSFLNPMLSDMPWGRMYKALTEGNLANGASVLTHGMAECGQILVISSLKEGQKPEAALTKLREIMEGFRDNPVTQEECDRARASLLSQRKGFKSSSAIGFGLSDAAAIGDWRLHFIERDRIKAMTPEAVQAAAVKYFIESNRTSGTLLPTPSPARVEVPGRPDVAALVKDYKGSEKVVEGEAFDATPENIDARTVRSKLGDSIQLACLNKRRREQTVNLVMTIRFGDEQSLRGKRAASELLGPLIYRGGSAKFTFQQVSDLLDNTQSHVGFSSQPGLLRVSMSSDREHYVQVIRMIGDLLRNPTFAEKEFANVQREMIAGCEYQLGQPQALADNAIMRALAPFPKSSFHYLPSCKERLAEFQGTTLDELKQLHREQFGPASVQIAVVGDFDAAVVETELRKILDGWGVSRPFQRVSRPFGATQAARTTIVTPDKPMAVVGLATAIEMSNDHPDAAAVRIAAYILGTGMNSRVAKRLRQTEGLSYDAYADYAPEAIDPVATLAVYATCATENVSKAAAALREEVNRWVRAGVTEEELAVAKTGYRQAILRQLGNDATIADLLAQGLHWGRTMQWTADRLNKIDSLTAAGVNDVLKRRFSQSALFEVLTGDLAPAETSTSTGPAGEIR